MCTLVILIRPDHDWPLILGANRDEEVSRTWISPGRHWQDRPNVIGGLDVSGGGSWMGLNDFGVVACILNRAGTLGPENGKRSRGEIVLDALDHEDAMTAADSMAHLNGNAFRDFNLFIADNRDAYWLKLDSAASDRVIVNNFPEGLSMLTSRELNDSTSQRIRTFLPRFRSSAAPDPESGDWSAWSELMGSGTDNGSPDAAMCINSGTGYGTTSSALLAMPSMGAGLNDPPKHVKWLFSAGPPDSASYSRVTLA